MNQNASIAQSGIPQIPLVQSTQILTQTTPIVNSQAIPANSVAGTQIINPPQTNQNVAYVPVVSTVKQPRAPANVKVVPIYDDY